MLEGVSSLDVKYGYPNDQKEQVQNKLTSTADLRDLFVDHSKDGHSTVACACQK